MVSPTGHIQDIAEAWGIKKLHERFRDPQLQDSFLGVLPRDNPRDTRFAIYYFHELNLDVLTEELRTHMKLTAQRIMQQQAQSDSDSGSDTDSSGSDSSDSDSDSSGSDSGSSNSDTERYILGLVGLCMTECTYGGLVMRECSAKRGAN